MIVATIGLFFSILGVLGIILTFKLNKEVRYPIGLAGVGFLLVGGFIIASYYLLK